MTSKQTIPSIQMDIDDDLAGSLDRQTNDQSPPLDRFESHSPTLTYTSYFGNDTTNNNHLDSSISHGDGGGGDDQLMSTANMTTTKPSIFSKSTSSGSSSSITPDHYLATQRSYLFALFTCPDMGAYLNNHDLPEDIYRLPLPLSTLLSESKEEVIASHQGQGGATDQQPMDTASQQDNNNKYSALDQLGSLREFAWAASGHDISNMMPVLDGLTKNEDQLGNIISKQRL